MFEPTTPNVDFVALEKEIFAYWQKNKILEKYLQKNKNSKRKFSFLDGPITANNPMGVHHAWGRTYKDLWQRFYNLMGYKQRFQNGFDCQGLWVEVEVEKELGLKTKKDIENIVANDPKKSIAKFVDLCKQRVIKFSKIQTEQSRRLGYFMDWDNSYFTMSDANNYMIWHFLKVCWQRGWIYKGHDVVPWCPRCETAISQHEMLTEDYQEVSHETVFVKFPVFGKKNEYLVIWTTTPWTVPANSAVAVGKKLEYSLVEVENGEKYWLATEAIDAVLGKSNKKIIKKVTGDNLAGLKYTGAFDHLPAVKKAQQENPELFHCVVLTDDLLMPISTQEGTGLVHTSPSTGEEDFRLGKKLGIPLVNPIIADNADYLDGLGEFSGKNAKKNPDIILDYLKNVKKDFLLKTLKYKHRYPRCWRCKAELVWKVADEWYIAMDKTDPTDTKKRTLRQQLRDVVGRITWKPGFGLDRELDWLKNMHDWLISKKNRYWGLALPIFECAKCGHFEVIGAKDELKQRAVSGWQKFADHSPHKPWIDEVRINCQKCQTEVQRISDVGNPWLDAGIVSFSTISKNNKSEPLYTTDRRQWQGWFPVDFITESFPGQFKNWFYSLLVMGTVLEKTNPFKTVLGFATLLGEDARPMHKSWGNAIEFNEAADKIGADVMRWMFALQDPEQNILFGYKKADETRRKFHLMFWNIYNFFINYALVDKFKPNDANTDKLTNPLDIWIISKFNSLIDSVTSLLVAFDAKSSAWAIEGFVTDLSQWYLRRSRERVGPEANKKDKQDFYNTLYKILRDLTILLAPFTPFLAEKIYINLTKKDSVHLADWPKSDKTNINNILEEEMNLARLIVADGHALRKEMGVKIRQPILKMAISIEGHYEKIRKEIFQIVIDELNIKNLSINNGKVKYPAKEVVMTEAELKKEGEVRDIVRSVQLLRKAAGLTIADRIKLYLPYWPNEYTEYIKQETQAETLQVGKKEQIVRI